MTDAQNDENPSRSLKSAPFRCGSIHAAYQAMLAAKRVAQDDDAYAALVALEYCTADGVPTATAEDQACREALLGVASRLDWVAPLTPIEDGSPYLFGAQASCAAFGISDYGVSSLPVGGRGSTIRAAFEGCIAEAIEALCLEGVYHNDFKELQSVDLVTGAQGPSLPQSTVRRVGSVSRESQLGSSGCAVAINHYNARIAGLFELIERDALALWWHGRTPPAQFPDSEASLAAVFGAAQAAGRSRWQLEITTDDLRVPVIIAMSSADTGRGVILGVSAGRTRAEAARNAALELFQMEYAAGMSLSRARAGKPLSDGDRLWLDRLRQHTAEMPWYCAGAPAREHTGEDIAEDTILNDLTGRIAELGETVLAVDLSRKDLPLPCVRIIAPALQSISGLPITSRLATCVLRSSRQSDTHAPIISPI